MSIKALKVAKAALKTPGVFAGGVAFGTLGYTKKKKEKTIFKN